VYLKKIFGFILILFILFPSTAMSEGGLTPLEEITESYLQNLGIVPILLYTLSFVIISICIPVRNMLVRPASLGILYVVILALFSEVLTPIIRTYGTGPLILLLFLKTCFTIYILYKIFSSINDVLGAFLFTVTSCSSAYLLLIMYHEYSFSVVENFKIILILIFMVMVEYGIVAMKYARDYKR